MTSSVSYKLIFKARRDCQPIPVSGHRVHNTLEVIVSHEFESHFGKEMSNLNFTGIYIFAAKLTTEAQNAKLLNFTEQKFGTTTLNIPLTSPTSNSTRCHKTCI